MKFTTLLLILAICSGTLCAQSPGGVSAPELWFQTKPVGTKLGGNYRWVDFSGDSLRLNVYDSQGAAYGEEYTTGTIRSYNGFPAISLDKLLDIKTREVVLKRTNLSQATVIGVFAPNAGFSSESLLYGLNGRPTQGVWVSNDKIYPSNESGKSVFDYGQTEGMDLRYSSKDAEPDENKYREGAMRIAAYYRSLPPSTGIWGERDKAVFTFGNYKTSNTNNSSTFSIPLAANIQFQGYIPEFITYNRLLVPLERRQVDSYLAIKYGLSLPVSYVGSQGQLLWDFSENPEYNNRLTAIYRDNASGLYLSEASTSYEEAPNYSDQVLNDYFYLNNPNNRTSSSRLLVMSRQYGNKIEDGSYLFWGDNNASYKLGEIEGVLGMKIMDRKWLIKTNITPTPDADKVLEWNVIDLDFQTSGFTASVSKSSANNAPASGVAYTKIPLNDKYGYLSISSSTLTLYGDVYIKLGSNQSITSPGSHDYGYYISNSKVYPIIKGTVATEPIRTLILTSSLEVEKRNNVIYLRVDGSRIDESEIIIDDSDKNKPFYGAISIAKGFADTKFILRHGGFVDTGNRIELSYAKSRANEFKNNSKGKSFLVIDRSGTGSFNDGDVEYIPSDEVDILREKVIFNNVFFDKDGNGGDVFTFAYSESNLAGDIETKDPNCNGVDGEVIIKLTSGTRAFKYTLTDLNTGDVVKQGRENSYNIHLTGLKVGDYEIKLEEAGGFNIIGENASGIPSRAKTTNFFPVFEGALEWMVTNTTDTYMIGYSTIAEDVNSSKNIIHYGLKKKGNKIYKIVSGKLENTSVTVDVGDVIKVEKTMSKVTYYKNGMQSSSSSIKWYDYLVKFYGLIDMSEGPAEILNVNATGFFNLADYYWSTTNGINVDVSENAVLTYQFSLKDPCAPPAAPQQDSTRAVEPAKEDKLKVYSIQGTNTLRASLELDEPDVVSFTAYNLNGTLVKKVHLSAPRNLQEADMNMPTTGVYIIKAITTTGEYSRKVMVQ